MRISIIVLVLAGICLAEDVDSKKRGVQKGSSTNTLNNAHPKPDTSKYHSQQQNINQQVPPSAPQQHYEQPDVAIQQQPNQHLYNVPQQIIPIHIIPHPLITPKYQILASRNPSGQMQLTLIPHNVFMNLVYGNPLVNAHLSQPVLTNHLQQTTSPTPTEQVYNNYVTSPPPLVYAQTNQVPLNHNNVYNNQQVPLPYTYSSTSPYNNYNNYITPAVSNSVYAPNPSQILNYYQNNPQAKYQLLYGPNNQHYEQAQSYQTIPSSEYEKNNVLPPHQVHKNDVSLHTNEYMSPPDTHFRPIHAYHRGPVSYKS